jgi:hypothetical protein
VFAFGSALRDGPWWAQGNHARTYLRLPHHVLKAILSSAQIDVTAVVTRFPFLKARGRRYKQAETFEPHWKVTHSNQAVHDLRQSLDEALGYLCLVELAIRTGYVP